MDFLVLVMILVMSIVLGLAGAYAMLSTVFFTLQRAVVRGTDQQVK